MVANRQQAKAAPDAGYFPGAGLPKLRVRVGRHYPINFAMDLGQRNSVFIKRPLTPLRRFWEWTDAFTLLPEPGYDIIHTWNVVPYLTRRPYIVTFEDFLPRVPEDRYVGWLEARLQQRLLSPQCVALIALSDYALRQFRHQNRYFAGRRALEAKMQVIRPSVALRRESPKQMSGKLKLLFVGGDYLRKGGPALMHAHERLRAGGLPVETTIVSALHWSLDSYVGPPSESYAANEHARLNQEGVIHHPVLPNHEVMRLMEEADFFVFPTFHDTFGFAPVEALSCGTPVLASDTCAMPEVVEDGLSGYLLPFENDAKVGKWKWIYRNREAGYVEAYDAAVRRMGEAITERLFAFWESRSDYEMMSAAALDRVRARFDKRAASVKLEHLYEKCRR